MPDITMCSGDGCKRKKLCFRHRAVPAPNGQSWFDKPPMEPDGACFYFMPANGKRTRRSDKP